MEHERAGPARNATTKNPMASLEKMDGWAFNELCKKTLHDFVHPNDRNSNIVLYALKSVEYPLLKKIIHNNEGEDCRVLSGQF